MSEREDILPFFKAHPHLAAFLGSYNLVATTLDRLAVEVRLSNLLVTDLVVGDWSKKAYGFVEFEDGKSDSIFADSGRSLTRWAPRFKDGVSQIVDWLWLIDDMETTWSSRRRSRHSLVSGRLISRLSLCLAATMGFPRWIDAGWNGIAITEVTDVVRAATLRNIFAHAS